MRCHIGRHADRDAARTVDEQVRKCGRKHFRLGELVVVVRNEVDDILVEIFGQRQCCRVESRLGVSGSGRAVVERAEVSVTVDERNAQHEILCQPHHGVIDRCVSVRVQFSHHLAHHAR